LSITSPAKSAQIGKGSTKSARKGKMERDLDKYVGEDQSEKMGKKLASLSKKSPTLS
jgi:hypothetical protein